MFESGGGRWGISCLEVVQVQLRAARNLCESWIDWWDEIQELPIEASRPEPMLEGLA